MDYDEIAFFHGGSLCGIPMPPGLISHAPQGVHHRAPEKARERARRKFDEYSQVDWQVIAIDTRRRLTPSAEVLAHDSDAGENPHARAEHADLLEECRTAVLCRVVALYDYHLALQRTRLDVEELQNRRRANTPATVDVATAAADEFLNRQAAARIAYLTENLDIARVISTHLVSTETSATMAKPVASTPASVRF